MICVWGYSIMYLVVLKLCSWVYMVCVWVYSIFITPNILCYSLKYIYIYIYISSNVLFTRALLFFDSAASVFLKKKLTKFGLDF